MKKLFCAILLCGFAAGLVGCSTGGKSRAETDAKRLAFIEAHAGEDVPSFPMISPIRGWVPLSDSAVLVYTRPNEVWLVETSVPCPELRRANSLGLTSFAGSVTAGSDTVTPRGAGTNPGPMVPCRIGRIRPVDVEAARQSEAEMRQAAVEERPATPSS